MQLTDQQWTLVRPHIPVPARRDGRGRPRKDNREILNGILWILRTGAQWSDLPNRFPPYQTCHRRFQEWVRKKVFANILTVLARDMEERGKIKLEECFIDGTFAGAKKGALWWVKPRREKEPKSWPYRIKTVFRSPSIWPLLLRMKSNWWKERLPADLPDRIRNFLSATGLMTATNWMKNY